MKRREFLQFGAASSGLLLPGMGLPAPAEAFTAPGTKRVGLIGSGWYGKADLLRLIQVAPVEVVSLCDVDKRMLAEAAEIVAARQASKKTPRTYGDYREMLKREGPRHRADRHARPLARPADDRRRGGRGRRLPPEADQRRRRRGPGDARRGAQASAGRPGRHAAPQHAAPDRGARPDHPRRASSARSGWSRSTAITTCEHAAIRPTRPRPTTSTRRCGPARRRCGRTIRSSIPEAGGRSWNTATASSATCASTCSTWSAGCSAWAGPSGSARRAASSSTRASKANIPDTQTATFDFGDLDGRLAAPHLGRPARPEVPLGRHVLRRQGDAQGERQQLRLHPVGRRQADPPGRRPTSWSNTPKTRPRRTWRSTSPRPSAAT